MKVWERAGAGEVAPARYGRGRFGRLVLLTVHRSPRYFRLLVQLSAGFGGVCAGKTWGATRDSSAHQGNLRPRLP